MKTTLIYLMVSMVTIIPYLTNPLAMGIFLLAQTLTATLIIAKMLTNSWMSMIMFLMFIGGLLILFMYMSSIASNEKFNPNYKMIFILMLLAVPLEELLMENQQNDQLTSTVVNEQLSLMMIYNKKYMIITILIFMYMFLSMIMVTKIIKIYKGPLRSK